MRNPNGGKNRDKVAFFELEKWQVDYLRGKLSNDFDLLFYDFALDDNSMADVEKDVSIICLFVFSRVSRQVIENFKKLKLIATMSTGFDHVDLKAAKARDICVSNVPAYGDNTVAEHAFALLLAISRQLVPSVERTRKGNFSLQGLRGFDLKGKILGVIGTGRIGQNAIRIANGFQMKVIAFDAVPRPELQQQLNFSYVSKLDDLLSTSDVITLHCPYNPSTHHLINYKNMEKLKAGVVLVNTARGAIVETEALLEALNKGIIAYAGLDVLEEEVGVKAEMELLSGKVSRNVDLKKVLANHLLLNRDNVLITPHNAFNSQEALKRILGTTIENIYGFTKGNKCNVVPFEVF